jgi:hypothetical protein
MVLSAVVGPMFVCGERIGQKSGPLAFAVVVPIALSLSLVVSLSKTLLSDTSMSPIAQAKLGGVANMCCESKLHNHFYDTAIGQRLYLDCYW